MSLIEPKPTNTDSSPNNQNTITTVEKNHPGGLPPQWCPISGSNKLPFKRQTDRQTDGRTNKDNKSPSYDKYKKIFFCRLNKQKMFNSN